MIISDMCCLVSVLLIGRVTCHKKMLYMFSDICSEQNCEASTRVLEKAARSKIECAAKCLNHGQCKSFFLDVPAGICTGYDEQHPASPQSVSYAGMGSSCSDISKAYAFASSGEYTIINAQHEPFLVYCDFYSGHGYTYISPDVSVALDIDDLFTSTNHVIIRHHGRDGYQYEARFEQIGAYEHIPLSIQFNSHVNFHNPSNDALTPYIFIGVLPPDSISKRQIVGFKVNGVERTYDVSHAFVAMYIAIFFNENNVPVTASGRTVLILQPWYIDSAVMPESQYMPNHFYSFFESHFAAHGHFVSGDKSPLFGAAVGLRFDITCPEPANITRTQASFSGVTPGSTVTYTCDQGYTLLYGDSTLTCDLMGQWTGRAPHCGG